MAICSFSPWGTVIMLYRVVLTFEFVNEELECKNFAKTYCTVLSCMWSADYSVLNKGALTFESVDVNCDYSYEN